MERVSEVSDRLADRGHWNPALAARSTSTVPDSVSARRSAAYDRRMRAGLVIAIVFALALAQDPAELASPFWRTLVMGHPRRRCRGASDGSEGRAARDAAVAVFYLTVLLSSIIRQTWWCVHPRLRGESESRHLHQRHRASAENLPLLSGIGRKVEFPQATFSQILCLAQQVDSYLPEIIRRASLHRWSGLPNPRLPTCPNSQAMPIRSGKQRKRLASPSASRLPIGR